MDIPAVSFPLHFHGMDLVSCLAHLTTPFVSGMQSQVIPSVNRSKDIPAMSFPSHFHRMDLVSCLAHRTTPFVSGMQRYLTLSPRRVGQVTINFYRLVGWSIRMQRSYSGFHHGPGRAYVSLEIQ